MPAKPTPFPVPPPTESAYDRRRLRQWRDGVAVSAGVERRDLLRLLAAASVGGPSAAGSFAAG
ncbi:hypothetical protein GT042_34485, partial [Streptomyces sp. SID3212]|nr:hypothetical protein [Streptomyces sp. SID3212]